MTILANRVFPRRAFYLTMVSVAATMMCGLDNAQAHSIMVIGNDEKITWDDAGKTIFLPDEGKDSINFVDISTPEQAKLISSLMLTNSIYGPPTNIDISPDQSLAFVANSMHWQKDGEDWQGVPNNQLYLIDLEGEPALIDTIEVGQQPSGISINPQGDLLLITHRAEHNISVVKIEDKKAELIDTIDVGEKSAAVAFTPDGERAFFVKKPQNKVGILDIDGTKVTYDSTKDINVGVEPYNIAVSPKGNIALVNNIGVTGGNDGNVDTLSVIDITAQPPHVIDHVTVGDGPEGLAISPDGTIAVSVLIRGSQNAKAKPETAWAYHENGSVAILAIDGTQVRKIDEIEVGRMPEGVVFSDDGQYIYVGNFLSKDISILKVTEDGVINTGETLNFGGSPASMR